MKNKILAIIAAILFTVYFATQCILWVDDSNQLIFEIARYASLLFQVIGASLLYFQGSFRYTLWRRIANFGIAAIFVGTLFKIQHWPGGAIFMNVGVAVCLMSYILHFVKKRNRTLKDGFKLGWLLSICSTILLSLYHIEYAGYVGMIGNCMLAIALAIHMKELWSAKTVNNSARSAIFDN